MKKDRSKQILKDSDFEKFPYEDTRYYGLFFSKSNGRRTVKIDPKRFQKRTGHTFTESQLAVINARRTHYFYPLKDQYYDYWCNIFTDNLANIQKTWKEQFKPLLSYAKKKIKKPQKRSCGDCELLMCGILDTDEANMWANRQNIDNTMKYEHECAEIVANIYAQFIHQVASKIEATTVRVLTQANAMDDHFDRNILYATAAGKNKKVTELPSFHFYDKIYCLWNFLKHNSTSTYEKVKGVYPEIIISQIEFHQGDFAAAFVKFSDQMVIELLNGCIAFFQEYCELVFNENYEQAQWNYNKYFLDIVNDEIELLINPMGLPDFL